MMMTKKFLFVDPAPKKPLHQKSMQILETVVSRLTAENFTENGNAYGDELRRFVLGLRAPGGPGEKMSLPEFAECCCLPLETVKEWITKG